MLLQLANVLGSGDGARAFARDAISVGPTPLASAADQKVRSLIRDAADQLCRVVDGNLDFVVQVSESDDDVDKLLLLVNFVLASARRSFNELSEVHRRVQEDLLAACKLQEKLLPEKLPRARNLRVAAKCIPARTVSGDFYDFFRYQRSGHCVGLLADVSGKGAAAAIYAALASGVVRSLADNEMPPAAMLSHLNSRLFARGLEGNFVAQAYFTWDDDTRTLELSNSGLPEPLLLRKGVVQTLPIHGLPLGLFFEANYEALRIQCEPGDTFVFYTDGVVDQLDRDGNEFGGSQLAEIISNTPFRNPADTVEFLFAQVSKHCQCENNIDDQTVIVLQVE